MFLRTCTLLAVFSTYSSQATPTRLSDWWMFFRISCIRTLCKDWYVLHSNNYSDNHQIWQCQKKKRSLWVLIIRLCTCSVKFKYAKCRCDFHCWHDLICCLVQWFSNLSWGPPTTAYFVCLPHVTHLIQLISSLVESARLEMGVA